MRFFWTTMLSLLLLSCSPQSSTASDGSAIASGKTATVTETPSEKIACPTVNLEPGDVRFCGLINDDAFEVVDQAIQKNAKRLVITSIGGRSEIAIRMSEMLAAAKINLTFESYCLSACASFLFLPATDPYVAPGTLIAFHHTTSSQAMLRARPDMPDKDRFASVALGIVNGELEFYERRGLSGLWLLEPMMRIGPTCTYRDIDWSDPAHPKLGYESKYQFWVPSRNMIETMGRGRFTGFWPETMEEAKALIDGLPQGVAIGRSKWFGSETFTTDVEWVAKLPFCTAGNP